MCQDLKYCSNNADEERLTRWFEKMKDKLNDMAEIMATVPKGDEAELEPLFGSDKEHPLVYPPGWTDVRGDAQYAKHWYPHETGNMQYKLMADMIGSSIN